MNILGIGPLELTLIILIALIILGPNDMVKTGKTLGRWMRKVVMSSEWRAVQSASRELRTLPNKLIREAGIEETQQAVKEQMAGIGKISKNIEGDYRNIQTDLTSWVTPGPMIDTPKQSSNTNSNTGDSANSAQSPNTEK
jgi:Sec-independent protein translocase protein TatA